MKQNLYLLAIIVTLTAIGIAMVSIQAYADAESRYRDFTEHTIICDGERVTLTQMSVREAASWGVDRCENMEILP